MKRLAGGGGGDGGGGGGGSGGTRAGVQVFGGGDDGGVVVVVTFIVLIFIIVVVHQHNRTPTTMSLTLSLISLTFAEDEVGGDVEGLDLDVVHGQRDALLVVGGDEREGLLGRAHVRLAGGGHQSGQAMRGGRVLPRCGNKEHMNMLMLAYRTYL